MPRKTTVKEFSFLEGAHQEIDPKILPDGYLSACKNVRLRKDGRWGVRADYTAIGNDTNTSADLVPRDLIGYGDRLCALGNDTTSVTDPTTIWDIFDYTGTGAEWHSSAQATGGFARRRVSNVTGLRRIPAYSPESLTETASSVTRIDCAAAGGVVCSAYSDGTNSATDNSFFRFIRASDLATILEVTIAGIRPRVVSVGTAFFFATINGNDLRLSKFDPATDAAHTVLTPASSSSFSAYDLVANSAGNGFWLAVNKTTPTTSIIPYDSAGTAGSAITGPAVLYDHIAIRETATRMHLVTVLAAGTCELYSYTLAGALSTGPTTIESDVNRQPGIADSSTSGTEQVNVAVEQTSSPSNYVEIQQLNATTHAVSAVTDYSESFLGAKPLFPGSSVINNFHSLLGTVIADGSFFSNLLTTGSSFSGNQVVEAFTNKFAALKPEADHTPQLARDTSTGKVYWPALVKTDEGYGRPVLTEVDFITGTRRQSAQIAGLLYLAGGYVGVYDGRALTAAGFFERPRILSATPSNGAGSLPSSVTLLVAIVWEARDAFDNVISSDISEVSTVTMGASDDTITIVPSAPHGWRGGANAICVAYRSTSGISQLRRAESAQATGAGVVLLASDATVRANGVIYTQQGRAALGTILPHEAPLPAEYIWKFGSRILSATADGAQVSKEIFPTAEVEWSGAVGFTIPAISERITGVAAMDQRGFLFTSERVYQFSGDGPNDAGEGRYSEPSPLPTSTGLMDWRSLVETPLGLFFQGSNGQLWVLPRDGSPPTWIGQPVRDTLVAFPTVTSATLVTKEQLVSFTCNNSGGTDSRIVSYDLRAKTWIVDEFASVTPIASACSYQGRLAILSSGVVYTEKTTLTPSAFIEHSLTTGTVKPFDWGKICAVEVTGEYRGDCNLRCRISYDDGKSYTNLATHLIRSTEFAVGDTVERSWAPLVRKCDGFKLDFQALTPGSASEGFVFNSWRIEYMPVRGASRRAAGARG